MTSASYGVDTTLITNLCGRTVKPDMKDGGLWWPWREAFRKQRPDGCWEFPGLELERAEVVVLYRRSCDVRLKLRGSNGSVGDVDIQNVVIEEA